MVKRSIFKKMLITMVSLIISLLMLLTLIQIEFQKNMFNKELEKRLVLMRGRLIDQGHILSENLAEQVKNGIAATNLSLVNNQLSYEVRENKAVDYIVLTQTAGKAYIHTQKPLLETQVFSSKEDAFALAQKTQTINEFVHNGTSYMEFIRPIKISSKTWGVLRLGYSLDIFNQEIINSREENNHQIREMIKRSLIISALFILVGALIVLMVSEHLSRPLIRLIRLANALSKGDFSASDSIKKKRLTGEIGSLTNAFVEMAKNLEITYAKLGENNRTLEQRVVNRTLELAEARDDAIAANKSKSEFLSVISHEIRTPMNAIIGMTRLILQTDLTAKQKDYLTKVQVSTRILLGIINDILDFSKIEAGKLELEKIVFNLDDVLNDLSSLMNEKALEKSLQLKIITADTVPLYLIGDPLRLEQVLLNLVSNALKFTSQGYITINIGLAESPESASKTDQVMLEFSVKDTGIGLSKEQIGGLFRFFNQADKSTTRKYGGTGLGLAICKRMVGMMKGEIHVFSEIDQGSTFIFTALFDLAPELDKKQIVNRDIFRGIKVLVVDANETSRNVLCLYLETFFFQVTPVSSGEQAIWLLENTLNEHPYQLVVMDEDTPEIDGVARQIKNDLTSACIPHIIMVIAQDSDDIIQRSSDLQLDGFLTKPVQPAVLFNAIFEAFGHNNTDGETVLPEANISEKPYDIQGTKLLLVEDNHINRQVAKETLEQEGFEVSTAINGQDAVKKIRTHYFDAVLMDLQMPVMDGYEATRIIRSESEFDHLPIIAMTAHAMDEVRDRCLHLGMNGYVTKPIDVDELLANLTDVINLELRKTQATRWEETHNQIALPEFLPGIEMQQILKNVAGNTRLLCDMLVKFHESFNDVQVQLDAFLRINDVESALQLLHALKGVAANLAMFELKACIERLEQTLKEQWTYEPELLTNFALVHNKVLESIGLLCRSNDQAARLN